MTLDPGSTPLPAPPPPIDAVVLDRPKLAPARPEGRVHAVDVLRGVALLGILVVNIYVFGLPFGAYILPEVPTVTGSTNLVTWLATSTFVLGKFISIFAMLFGAGMILMGERAEARGITFGPIYYRRLLWLLVIGAAHGYLLWKGDVLFSYAVGGLVLYPLRRKRPRTLFILAAVGFFVASLGYLGTGAMIKFSRQFHESSQQDAAAEAELVEDTMASTEELFVEGVVDSTAIEALEAVRDSARATESEDISSAFTAQLGDAWLQMRPLYAPTDEDVATEIEKNRSGYLTILEERVPYVMSSQLSLPFLVFWEVAGLMLIGMGLMKLGVFSAARSLRFYVRLLGVGFSVGFLLTAAALWLQHLSGYDPAAFMATSPVSNLGALFVAFGYIALVMLACKLEIFVGLQWRLAAVGRTALTNYLAQAVIGTTLFYGYGLGLFGRLDRAQLMLVVLGIWILQLVVSPLWLRYFRFGPAEWLWRSLTYWRRQPMRRMVEAG